MLVFLNTKRWSFRGLSVCHCTSLRVRKHINKHPFLRHSPWDERVYSSSTAREIAGKRRLPAQQISRWPWTGSPALGWQMEPRESNQAQQRICGEDPSLLCTPAISPLHLLTSLSSVTSKVDAWMGDSTWPRCCFLPPPHFTRRWVCVWVGEEERREPLSLRDSSAEGLLESQDQYLLIYILAQMREWNSGGRESGEGWRQGGRKRWQMRITIISPVGAKRGAYFIHLHRKLYSTADPHGLLCSLKQFCPDFHHWKQTE